MKKSWLEALATLGPIVLAIGAGLIAWGNMQASIQSMNVRLTADEVKIDAQTTEQTHIEVQLSDIQTNIEWIKAKLSGQ
jgi:uncharacterized protein HemX